MIPRLETFIITNYKSLAVKIRKLKVHYTSAYMVNSCG